MIIDFKQLIHLPVYTESGTKLGQIHDLDIDIAEHTIRRYIVEPKFFGKESYRIAPLQIKSITSEKIIVEDAVATEQAAPTLDSTSETSNPVLGGVISSQQEIRE
jgi:sporulation protein YlmC with PRC-barrel domain